MEDGFQVWLNPFGDNCSGSKAAAGWQGFTSRGQYGSSCFVVNEYAPNVFSGRYSQEITFDFVDSHAGLFRTFDSQPNHTYQVTARLRHVHTLPPMQFHFGDKDHAVSMGDVQIIRDAHPDIPSYVYDDAAHGFCTDDREGAYNPAASARAHERIYAFLEQNVG